MRAVVLGARHAPRAVLAAQQAALAVARVAVGEVGGLAERAHGAGLLVPAHHAVVGDVAPQQVAAVAEPHRALGPAEAGRQPLDRGAGDAVLREARIEDLDGRVGVALGGLPHGRSLRIAAPRRRSMKAMISPMMPRRKASTQITKIRPVTMVTDSPSVLNQSMVVMRAMKVPKSPILFSSSTTTAEPTSGPDERAQAADQRHQDHLARGRPVHVGQRGEAQHQRLERAGQARQRGRDHEGQQLEAAHVVAQRDARAARFP